MIKGLLSLCKTAKFELLIFFIMIFNWYIIFRSMEYPFNFFYFCFIYFIVQFITYRLFNINISKILTIVALFVISSFLIIRANSIDLIYALINFNLFVFCLYVLMPGIINNGPALIILDILTRNKTHSKKKIRSIFKKKALSLIIKNRLKINIQNNFISKKRVRFFIQREISS